MRISRAKGEIGRGSRHPGGGSVRAFPAVGWLGSCLLGLLGLLAAAVPAEASEPPANWWPLSTTLRLAEAGENRDQLERALQQVSRPQRDALRFLIEHMPAEDLGALSADFLLENVRLACEARERVPWGKQIPEAIFLNDVLPYANVNERRDAWRKQFFELCWPLVKDCSSPAEAAETLNAKLFQQINVRYSTKRRKPHQSPLESMELGLASCTGLSIVLSDACRSVCVPARLAGIPSWPNKPGNHTWVEIWDKGWHFTGACEPSKQGLDHAWFQADAALADRNSPLHAIYAASFRQTGTAFPLVWSRDQQHGISAINVTERYARPEPPAADQLRLMVRVRDGATRVAADVQLVPVAQPAARPLRGTSRDESADTNDLLTFQVARGAAYKLIVAGPGGRQVQRELEAADAAQQVIEIQLPPAPGAGGERP